MRNSFSLLLLLLALACAAASLSGQQAVTVIPQPMQVTMRSGEFVLKKDTRIVVDVSALRGPEAEATGRRVHEVAELLTAWLEPATKFKLQISNWRPEELGEARAEDDQPAAQGGGPPAASRVPRVMDGEARALRNVILLKLDASLARLGDEGYTLEAERQRIEIRAPAPAGIFYGAQTLRQLLPPEIFRTEQKQTPAAEDAEKFFAGAPLGAPELEWFANHPESSPDRPLRGTASSAPAESTPRMRWAVPGVTIVDRPRFAWRGAHLDVARHFFPKEFILKFIDTLALHKLNVFHWHLVDDQGWRIEIKQYPKLTQVGAWRKETRVGKEGESEKFDGTPHGGFYTQEEIREVVEYARRRFIAVVPEIEMPGHAQAAIAAYPELGTTGQPLEVMTYWGVSQNIFNVEESTIAFLQNVLDEVLALFPSKFIHIGGDEAVKDQWRASPRVQERMRELGVKNEEELQSWFIRRMDQFLTARGRRLVGWDEILEGGLADGATVMSWRGVRGGIEAAKSGHDVVMAPSQYTYFDHYQSRGADEPLAIGGFTPLEKVYAYEPVPDALSGAERQRVLGAQGQLWTEYIPTAEHLEYMAWPRLCALAEVVWTPQELRVWPSFQWRLRTHVLRLQGLGVRYRSPNKPVVPPAR
jgi:hexosaminidase